MDQKTNDLLHRYKPGDYVGIKEFNNAGKVQALIYKVIGCRLANAWVDVPIRFPAFEKIHMQIRPVVVCVGLGIDESAIRKYLVEDVSPYNTPPISKKREICLFETISQDGSIVKKLVIKKGEYFTLSTGEYDGWRIDSICIATKDINLKEVSEKYVEYCKKVSFDWREMDRAHFLTKIIKCAKDLQYYDLWNR